MTACNANPTMSGLYSCGGATAKFVKIMQSMPDYMTISEIRVYPVSPMLKSAFTLTHSAYSSCGNDSQDLFSWPAAALVLKGFLGCR